MKVNFHDAPPLVITGHAVLGEILRRERRRKVEAAIAAAEQRKSEVRSRRSENHAAIATPISR